MKRILLVLFILLPAFGCGHKGDCLRNGDLIFVGLPMDYDAETGSIDEAISSATGDGALPPYWEWLFGKLGMEVPQDLPGTNPQDMSISPCLVDVPASISGWF